MLYMLNSLRNPVDIEALKWHLQYSNIASNCAYWPLNI
jgi:hypothetical protein